MATEKNPLSIFPDDIREMIELAYSDVYSDDAYDSPDLVGLHDRAKKVQENMGLSEFVAIVNAYLKYRNNKEEEATDVPQTALQCLLAKIEKVNKKKFNGSLFNDADVQRAEAVVREIQTFPLPSDKEELLEIIYYIKPYLKKTGGFEISAYKTRFKEIREMVNSRYPNDPELTAAVYVKPGFMARLFSKIFGKK